MFVVFVSKQMQEFKVQNNIVLVWDGEYKGLADPAK